MIGCDGCFQVDALLTDVAYPAYNRRVFHNIGHDKSGRRKNITPTSGTCSGSGGAKCAARGGEARRYGFDTIGGNVRIGSGMGLLPYRLCKATRPSCSPDAGAFQG